MKICVCIHVGILQSLLNSKHLMVQQQAFTLFQITLWPDILPPHGTKMVFSEKRHLIM